MSHRLIMRCAVAMLLLAFSQSARAAFDLQFTVDPNAGFNPTQRALLLDALADAEALWEGVITGYQPGISVTGISITVGSDAGGNLAQANGTDGDTYGGFFLYTKGRMEVNSITIDWFAPWNGEPGPMNPPPQYLGLNYLDDIVAHEIGHVLGIGTLWIANDVYVNNSFQYTGEQGVAAYRKEFDPLANFVPVEDANLIGTQNSHWNQRMRSAPAPEGTPPPADPWILDPRVGITNAEGRDFASELMTGALDPDYGEPFLSLTTIYSLRDLGYSTVPEPGTLALVALAAGLLLNRRSRVGI